MSKKIYIIIVLILLFAGLAQGSITKPTATLTGVFSLNQTEGIQLKAKINQVTYYDGTTTNVDTPEETIIGAWVNLSNVVFSGMLGGDYLFTDGTLSVSDDSGTYLTASIVHVVIIGSYINFNFDTKNLQNVSLNTSLNSRFIQELNDALSGSATKELAVSFTLELFTGSFDTEGFGNVQGLLDGAPIKFIAEPKTIGFWKHQINQNGHTQFTPSQVDSLVTGALSLDASICNVFGGDAQSFKNALTETGRRDALGKAKQQLAALLMNYAAGYLIDEVPIILPITPASTVGEALDEVDCKIKNEVDLDRAKSIADLINNGIGIIQ